VLLPEVGQTIKVIVKQFDTEREEAIGDPMVEAKH